MDQDFPPNSERLMRWAIIQLSGQFPNMPTKSRIQTFTDHPASHPSSLTNHSKLGIMPKAKAADIVV
jgi:hypothetical protein